MTQLSDIEIAQSCTLKPIQEIASKLGLSAEQLDCYGRYKAKLRWPELKLREQKGKLVLVTAINPTAAGEGKTTTTIGLADALNHLNYKTAVALREPSLGPVFGIKGGAAGGGYAQVVPMEDINLHFTGDFHAISAANNLLAALLDNHLHQGNALGIDPRRITWKRCVDMNDRQLRHIVCGLNGRNNGVAREDGFDITVASEIMAILCLAQSLSDLKERLGRIVVAYTYEQKPVTCADLQAQGALCALLKDALNPNLVQTLEGTPALVHGGPFANIAHGCNSLIATKTALGLADYTITEAGFGADLGAEKFLDIKCRLAGLEPDATVVVATIRALKLHGGLDKKQLGEENLDALKKGLPNLLRHLSNLKEVFNLPSVVAINRFPTDHQSELDTVLEACQSMGIDVVLSEVWAKGGQGGLDLARAVVELCERPHQALTHPYSLGDSLYQKLEALCRRVYRGQGVSLTKSAQKELEQLKSLGYGHLPICMAKTPYSFSDDPSKVGAPEHFKLTIRQLKLSAGAGFIVALTGDVMTMPGLPKTPAANRIDVTEDGKIVNLF